VKGTPRFARSVGLVIILDAVLLWMPPGPSILDARPYYSAAEALVYLEELGPAGRTTYFVHECVDLVFIAAYTLLLRQLAARWRVTPRILLFAPGAADVIETAGILVLLGMGTPRSRLLAGVIGYATCCKWLALVAVIASFAAKFCKRIGAQRSK
jgi:hypothetical protein